MPDAILLEIGMVDAGTISAVDAATLEPSGGKQDGVTGWMSQTE